MDKSEIWGHAAGELLIVGLTGGIAAGKTEVASELRRMGAMVIDADQAARDVVVPGTEVNRKLIEEFGRSILDSRGNIDRPALANKVFGNESKRQRLNSIIHPAIFAEMLRKAREYAASMTPGDVRAVIIDAALIVDIGASAIFDLLIVVTADEGARVRRLIRSGKMSEEDARRRVASQVSDSKRLSSADLVIENNGTVDELKATVAVVWEDIKDRVGPLHS